MQTKFTNFPGWIVSFLLMINFYSCKKNDVLSIAHQEKLTVYELGYTDIYAGMPATDSVKLLYDSNGRPIKRIGGFITLSAETGYGSIFSTDVYDTILYNANHVVILNKTSKNSQYVVSENKREMLMDGSKITEMWNVVSNHETDTLRYFYSGDKLIQILGYYKRLISKQDFYYNDENNLDSTVLRSVGWSNQPLDERSENRTIEIFKNYDTYQNPTNNLMLFSDLFKRSLSKNNFSSYSRYIVTAEGINSSLSISWTLHYTNGKIDFSN